MILPDLILQSRINQRWQYSGIDSLEHCLNREHFQSYPYPIEYSYNSRGFRDKEWPTSLKGLQEAVWCIGDSFTVGIGQPFEHTWPTVLAKKLNTRTVNVSMDGASNDWICRRVFDIAYTINPKAIVVMWSYVQRREDSNNLLDDEQRRIQSSKNTHHEDIQRWLIQVLQLKKIPLKIIQSCIPDFCGPDLPETIWNAVKDKSWPSCPQTPQELENLPVDIKTELQKIHQCFDDMMILLRKKLHTDIIYIDERLDWARDYHHFDILTSRWIVDQIETRLRM